MVGRGEGCEEFVWRKKTVEKVPKIIKKKNSRRKSPFRFPLRILIYFQNSDRCFLFATRVYYTRPMVYGRKFTTRMPFYNVAVIPRYIIVDRLFGRLEGYGPEVSGGGESDRIILIGLSWGFLFLRVIEFPWRCFDVIMKKKRIFNIFMYIHTHQLD